MSELKKKYILPPRETAKHIIFKNKEKIDDIHHSKATKKFSKRLPSNPRLWTRGLFDFTIAYAEDWKSCVLNTPTDQIGTRITPPACMETVLEQHPPMTFQAHGQNQGIARKSLKRNNMIFIGTELIISNMADHIWLHSIEISSKHSIKFRTIAPFWIACALTHHMSRLARKYSPPLLVGLSPKEHALIYYRWGDVKW